MFFLVVSPSVAENSKSGKKHTNYTKQIGYTPENALRTSGMEGTVEIVRL